ncbi:MAG: hypothetical protein ACE5GX_15090 [Thermoanaerobaculia bacterium]
MPKRKRLSRTLTTASLVLGLLALPSAIRAEADATSEEPRPDSQEHPDELEALLQEFEEQEAEDKLPDYDSPEYDYLGLGIGRSYMKTERFRLHDQILTFIPPLYQPAFVGHGYVLPPRTWRIAIGATDFDIETDDFFKASQPDFVHENHSIARTRVDFDLFYGLDHDMTVRVNIPYWSSQSDGSVHPAGVRNLDLFVEGTSGEVGDIQLFVKKKFWDQANRWFNFAGVLGVKLPTGANDEKFDQPMVVRNPMGQDVVAFGGGAFPRFSNDGRLPSGLQPGTGGMGYLVGLFGTRQLTSFSGALHAGFLARFLEEADGVEPGDELRFFVSFVKPVYEDYLSFEIAVNGMDKASDSYEGTFTHPIPDPATGNLAGVATTPRPPFREGTIVFASPSLIFIPNPFLRVTATTMIRLNNPNLGPWPQTQFKLGTTVTF